MEAAKASKQSIAWFMCKDAQGDRLCHERLQHAKHAQDGTKSTSKVPKWKRGESGLITKGG